MNRLFPHPVRLRLFSSRLSSLLLLFQRSPIVQIILPEARILGGAGLGEITMWSVATVVGLGAYDSVAGATTIAQISPNAGSATVNATQNKALSFVFQLTGYPDTPGSWKVTGLPAGLVHADAKNNTVDSVSGSPTETGSFPVKVTAYSKTSYSGDSYSKTFTMNVAVDPAARITTHPSSATINSGQTRILNVAAAGSAPLTYQWFRGNSGATGNPVGNNSASFTTPALTSTTSYWVRVSNAANPSGDNSNTATITVIQPATIVTDPVSKSINSGQSTSLAVVASGTAPLSYQWYQGVSGATGNPVGINSSSFTTPVLTATTSYWVKVTNAANATGDNSATATITVNQPATIVTHPAATTINSGGTATLNVNASGTAPLAYQWFEGSSGVTTKPVGTNSPVFNTPALTADTDYWVKVTNVANPSGALSNTARISVNQPAAITAQPASTSVVSGDSVNLTVSASGTAPIHYQWYEGAAGDTSLPVGTDSETFTSPPLTASTSFWVRLSNMVNPGGTDSNTAVITVNTPVMITQQPVPVTINSGETTTLNVAATGTQPIAYQWYLGDAGDTSTPVGTDSFQFTTPSLAISTTYWLRVFNVASPQGVDSIAVRVTILGDRPAAISSQPQSTTIANGAFTTLSVTASGLGPFTYQWYQGLSGDTSAPVGTNSNSFTTPTLSATANYWVLVSNLSNPAGALSQTATVTVPAQSPAAVDTQPAAALIARGTSAMLNVTASGTAPLTYQWYQGTSGDVSNPVGTNSPNLTTPVLNSDSHFWVRVTNEFNAAGDDSQAALVTVHDPSTITTQPASTTIPYNTATTLNVAADGTAPLIFQWYRGSSGDTSQPVGGNSPSFTTPNLSATTSYWVKVSNTLNAQGAASNAALVTVGAFVPVQITTQPVAATVNRGESAELSVTASGSAVVAYQWYQGLGGDTSNPVGTNSSNLTTPPVFTASGFWVRVSNGGSSVDSDLVQVTPLAATDLQEPAGTHLANGATRSFGKIMTGSSKVMAFTIHNAGSVNLSDLSVSRSGANASDFQITQPSKTNLPGDASTTFSVTFKPSGAGTRTATLRVTSGLTGEPAFDLKLTGTGENPVPEISMEQPKGMKLTNKKEKFNFGSAKVGKKKRTLTFFIYSDGTGDLANIKVSIVGAKKDFILTKPNQTVLPAGSVLKFTVAFKPLTTGNRNAEIQVISNDADENPFRIKISGLGTP